MIRLRKIITATIPAPYHLRAIYRIGGMVCAVIGFTDHGRRWQIAVGVTGFEIRHARHPGELVVHRVRTAVAQLDQQRKRVAARRAERAA